jgi:hypothetical protein
VGKTVNLKKKSSLFFHRLIRSNYFLHCFSTDQLETDLQIVSPNLRHDLISVAFKVILEIEMHLHGPANKTKEKPITKTTTS